MDETLEKFGLKKPKIKRSKYLLWSVSMGALLFLIFAFLIVNRQPEPVLVVDDSVNLPIKGSISIDFAWPVARQLEVSISPEAHGQIVYTDMVLNDRLSQGIIFEPELTWLPGTTYEITLRNVKSAIPTYQPAKEYKLYFTTESLPQVSNVKPVAKENAVPDMSWEVYLDKPNHGLAIFDFSVEPAIDFSTELSDDKTYYTITPNNLLAQGQEYSFSVIQKDVRYGFDSEEIAYQNEGEAVWQSVWQTREAPGIESFSPQGDNISLDQDIQVVFDENIDFDSFKENVSITPELSGTWQTEDYKTLTFQTDDLQKDTYYEVIIKDGTRTFTGGYLEESSTHNFTTLGAMKLLDTNPSNSANGITIQSDIEITFDQSADHASAESKFSINPQVSGSFSWDGNKMVFNPESSLDFNTSYTVTMASGVKSNNGFDSEQDFIFSFSTELSVTKLPIAFNRQDRNLSCEVATLVMALSYYDVNVPEQPLIDAIGTDGTLHLENGVWGNPHIAFVGDIDGRQISTGYGVYWEPIARAAQAYRPAYSFSGWTVQQVTEQVAAGNPVIIWGTAGSGARVDWKTSSGDNVVAIMGEHTFVVTGFVGSASNPSKIIVLDPLYGERYKTISNFEWMWGLLGNSGVVVE